MNVALTSIADRPPFGVLLKTPSQVLAGGDITGSVRAL